MIYYMPEPGIQLLVSIILVKLLIVFHVIMILLKNKPPSSG